MLRKQTDMVQLKLRFPEKLRIRIEAAARNNQRSMNSEIISRLERSFEREQTATLVQTTATATAEAVFGLQFRATPEAIKKGFPIETRRAPKTGRVPHQKKDEP
jgi:Arc-like DNA binding domain